MWQDKRKNHPEKGGFFDVIGNSEEVIGVVLLALFGEEGVSDS